MLDFLEIKIVLCSEGTQIQERNKSFNETNQKFCEGRQNIASHHSRTEHTKKKTFKLKQEVNKTGHKEYKKRKREIITENKEN